MPHFTDSLERNWSIEIDCEAIKLLRRELNIDLLSVCDEGSTLLQQLANDEILLVDVLSVLLTQQIKERSIDAKGFARGLVGQGLQNAVDSLITGIADFSRPQKGALIRRMWTKINELEAKGTAKMADVLNSNMLDEKLQREIDSRLEPLRS